MRRAKLALCLAALWVVALPAAPAGTAAHGNRRLDPALGSAPSGLLVHGAGGDLGRALGAIARAGAAPGTVFERIGVAYATLGSEAQLAALARDPGVEYLEADRPLRYLTAKPSVATRQDAVYSRPVRDPWGRVVDGRGVGVAVIDSGLDGTHPDLGPLVARNMKVVCRGGLCDAVDWQLENSDDGGGHGTHVSGIVAGTGGSSTGKYAGNARGTSLYGLGAGAGLHVLTATTAMNWVLENHARVTPPIRVVNNSWGGDPGPYDPRSVFGKLTGELVNAGVVVVWAAGNEGGDGSDDMTTPQSKHPAGGSLSVANYDDRGTGTRSGRLDSSSSRGAAADASTWPDVSAPGANVMSTCRLTLPVCNAHLKPSREYPNLYAELSGTSMAAPQVAGIAAQLLQANPSLTPASVEWVFEASAYKFSFGAPYAGGSSFDKGHGLVDVIEALRLACAACQNL